MTYRSFLPALTLALISANAAPAFAQSQEELQKQFNAQVAASPFNAGDLKKAEAYAADAQKKGIEPPAQPPSYWSPGWTCANVASYRYYNYGDYRNCVYYHHYYHRYW